MRGQARPDFTIIIALVAIVLAVGFGWAARRNDARHEASAGVARMAQATAQEDADRMSDVKLDEMKEKLSPEQYNVCFLKGTEPPFSGKYYKTKDVGEYHCAACDALLFKSNTKFDSGTGWPSFWDEGEPGAIDKIEDSSHGMTRTEVTCAKCGAHLGHVFDDGPAPTGQRYCINSLSLEFKPAAKASESK